jgi:hypothetical protein
MQEDRQDHEGSDHVLTTLSAFEFAVFWDGELVPSTSDLPRWSGINPPPATGEIVKVHSNGIGPAKVIGYFVESDWLGLLVKPFDPPEWFVRQNGYDASCHVFGAEIGADLAAAPVLTGPDQTQLAALQRFANAKGRAWKSALSIAWQTGADEREPDGCYLRQVRNRFGGKWLYSDRNPIRPGRPDR